MMLAFTSLKIWRWRLMCKGQHLAALPPCTSCKAFVATYCYLSSIPLFLHLFSACWITATVFWLTCLSSISSQSKMPQQGSFFNLRRCDHITDVAHQFPLASHAGANYAVVSKKWHWRCTLQLQCTSTDFADFWHRYCWVSTLLNSDLLSHLS